MAIHEGHRDRMRERISKYGIESLQDHEVLEYLLYATIPRKDTNPLAHLLIESFGSFSSVLNADPLHLSEIDGVSYITALYLTSLPSVFSTFHKSRLALSPKLDSPNAIKDYYRYTIGYLPHEEVHMVLKNNRGSMINHVKISKGTVNECGLPIRETIETALKHKASSVILIHNHPTLLTQPSSEDIRATVELGMRLAGSQLRLDDHIIVSGDTIYSMREAGLLKCLEGSKLNVEITNGVITDVKY